MLTRGQNKALLEQGDDGTKPSASLRGVSPSAEKDLQRPGIFMSRHISVEESLTILDQPTDLMAKSCVSTLKERNILRHLGPVLWEE